MARRRPRYWVPLVTTVIVFVLSVPLAFAVNAASALGRWPGWLDVVRRHPVRSVAVLVMASLVVLAVAVIWDKRSPEAASTDDLLDVEGRHASWRGSGPRRPHRSWRSFRRAAGWSSLRFSWRTIKPWPASNNFGPR